VVFGEVMVPAPELRSGQVVDASELEGRLHFDGGHMVANDIVRLVDEFARERCPVDIMHDRIPCGAGVVESFVAYEGDAPWIRGAWVVGVKIHDDDIWERIESEELRAFSIHFIVDVQRIDIKVRGGGEEKDLTTFRFSNARPQFLSLVDKPATTRYWAVKQRSVRPLPGQVVDREWDADAARQRVEEWAKAEEGRSLADGCLVFGGDGGQLVADVDGGRLVVVRRALEGVDGEGLDDTDRAFLAAMRTVVPFQDLPLADLDTEWDAAAAQKRVQEWAGGDDWAPEEFRRAYTWYDSDEPGLLGSYKLGIADVVDGELTVVPRAVFAAAGRLDQTDISEADRAGVQSHLGRYYDKMDRTPPWEEERAMPNEEPQDEVVEREEEPAAEVEEVEREEEVAAEPEPEPAERKLYAVIDGVPQLAPEGYQGEVYTLSDDGSFVEVSWVERADFGSMIADAQVGQEANDMLWLGTSTLHSMFYRIMETDAETSDKLRAMGQAVKDFAVWAITNLEQTNGQGFGSADSVLGLTREEMVERAGRKMSKARLKKFKAALDTLGKLLAELDDSDGEVDRAEEEVERRAEEPAETPAEKIEREIDLGTEIKRQVDAAVQRALKGRPAPSSVDTDGSPEPETQPQQRTSRDIARAALGLGT
jgi:hypothetical protein